MTNTSDTKMMVIIVTSTTMATTIITMPFITVLMMIYW